MADLELEAAVISSVAETDKAKIDALIDSVVLENDDKLSPVAKNRIRKLHQQQYLD